MTKEMTNSGLSPLQCQQLWRLLLNMFSGLLLPLFNSLSSYLILHTGNSKAAEAAGSAYYNPSNPHNVYMPMVSLLVVLVLGYMFLNFTCSLNFKPSSSLCLGYIIKYTLPVTNDAASSTKCHHPVYSRSNWDIYFWWFSVWYCVNRSSVFNVRAGAAPTIRTSSRLWQEKQLRLSQRHSFHFLSILNLFKTD